MGIGKCSVSAMKQTRSGALLGSTMDLLSLRLKMGPKRPSVRPLPRLHDRLGSKTLFGIVTTTSAYLPTAALKRTSPHFSNGPTADINLSALWLVKLDSS